MEADTARMRQLKASKVMEQMRSNVARASDEWQSTVKKKILNFMVFMFSVPCVLVFLLGGYDVLRNVEENKCQMTFMFEYPQYVQIPLEPAISHKFPMYGLYAYAEGKHIEPARNLKFTGIPVLFLPGNAGSYKQVRSVASVALRKWLDNRTPFHFDFFSVDFHEELSGLYGYVLPRQSEYLKRVVEKITSLYEDYHQIVIIGHSMGGVLAKSINEDSSKVQLIYTLATPHLHPPIITDPELELFYYYVSRNWTTVLKREDSTPVTLVSVAGGERDLLVSEKYTSWRHNTIHTSAPAMPTVWASTDHLCIVWCKQLVMTIVRSLFDLVEYKQQQKYYGITDNSTVRETVLNYHFIKRTSGKSFHSAHPKETQGEKPPRGNWTEILRHSYCEQSFHSSTYVMIPQVTFTEKMHGPSRDYQVLVATTNTDSKNWIFGCTNLGVEQRIKYCSEMENLSNETVVLPSFHRNRKVIHLNAGLVSKYSHLIVKMGATKFKTCLDVEVYKVSNRTPILGTAIQDTQNAMFYNLTYPVTFNQSKLFSWKMDVQLKKDASGKPISCAGHHSSVGMFKHGNFQTHNFFKNESLTIRFADTSVETGYALLYLSKGCSYSIRVNVDWVGTAGQFFRVGVKLLPAYFASIILMTLFFQKPTGWINFHRLLIEDAYKLAIVPGFIVALCVVFLPTDYRYMLTEAEYSALLPMICYFVAYGLVLVVSLGLWLLTLTFGNGLHGFITRFIGKKLGSVPDKVTDLALTFTMDKFPVTIAISVIAVAMSTSGALGIALGFVLHILKIFKGYEGILEDLIRCRIKEVSEGLSPINFQMHCALLWMVVTAINIPSLLYWINSFKFVEIPNWDLSLYLCLMLTPTLAFLWQDYVPSFNPAMWGMQRYLCYVMGIVVAVYGTHRIYLISLIIVLVLVSLAVCQVISSLAEGIEDTSTATTTANDSAPTEIPQPPISAKVKVINSQNSKHVSSASEDSEDELPPRQNKPNQMKEDLEASGSPSTESEELSEDSE